MLREVLLVVLFRIEPRPRLAHLDVDLQPAQRALSRRQRGLGRRQLRLVRRKDRLLVLALARRGGGAAVTPEVTEELRVRKGLRVEHDLERLRVPVAPAHAAVGGSAARSTGVAHPGGAYPCDGPESCFGAPESAERKYGRLEAVFAGEAGGCGGRGARGGLAHC